MQTGVDLLDQARLRFDSNLLITALLQALNLESQPRILAVDSAQDFPIVQRVAVSSLLLVKMGAGDDGVDQVALILHQAQGAFEVRFARMEMKRLAQNVHTLVEVGLSFHLPI